MFLREPRLIRDAQAHCPSAYSKQMLPPRGTAPGCFSARAVRGCPEKQLGESSWSQYEMASFSLQPIRFARPSLR